MVIGKSIYEHYVQLASERGMAEEDIKKVVTKTNEAVRKILRSPSCRRNGIRIIDVLKHYHDEMTKKYDNKGDIR